MHHVNHGEDTIAPIAGRIGSDGAGPENRSHVVASVRPAFK